MGKFPDKNLVDLGNGICRLSCSICKIDPPAAGRLHANSCIFPVKLIAMTARLAAITLILLCWTSCKTGDASIDPRDALIPMPASVNKGSGEGFKPDPTTRIITVGQNPELDRLANVLGSYLRTATGHPLPVSRGNGNEGNGHIYLRLDANSTDLGAEGYTLKVDKQMVAIAANQPAGIFNAIQTIKQLLPAEMGFGKKLETALVIPAVGISDQPVYAYRGAMLDVSRHFFSVEDVKRYIDLICAYKMNVLHLHLSDDQGWRIEIKSWPKLTETGGSTQVGGGKGGFYTQEQYKEIVNYAAQRYMMVIPEIDMPGHTNAALASYPELNCNDTATQLYSGTEVGFSTLCTDKEVTYKFIDDVIRELAAITPGPYIHIGGDESHATPADKYVAFMNRVQPVVSKYGKKVIGWDEIATATLQPNTVVQFWADTANTLAAIKQGAQVIMSPAKKAYLDMQYDSTTKLGLHWAAYVEVDDAYNWDPANYLEGVRKDNILGIEAPIWMETIVTMDDLEYMAFPRLPGLAEIGWTPSAGRNWENYRLRIAEHGPRMRALGIDFYPSARVTWK